MNKAPMLSEFLRELCGECGGCSEMPTSIERLCSNPLEKYLYRMCKTESEAYFRGRRDGLTILEANIKQAKQETAREIFEKVENPYLYFGSPHTENDIESNAKNLVFKQCRQAILEILES